MKTPGLPGFSLGKLNQIYYEENTISILIKYFQKNGEEEAKTRTIQLFRRLSITVIGKPDKDRKLKENYIPVFLMNVVEVQKPVSKILTKSCII